MSDTCEDIQVVKNKRSTLREKLQKRKRERQEMLRSSFAVSSLPPERTNSPPEACENVVKTDEEILLQCLSNMELSFPTTSQVILSLMNKNVPTSSSVSHTVLCSLLHKFSLQKLINTNENTKEGEITVEIISVEQSKLAAITNEIKDKKPFISLKDDNCDQLTCNESPSSGEPALKKPKEEDTEQVVNDIMCLIETPSIREKELKKMGEEILQLLSKPTAKELSLAEKFRSQGGTQLMEFCTHRTRQDCLTAGNDDCKKLHFKKLIEAHTEETLGDCSYLNTCFHIATCKYVHYEVDRTAVVDNDEEQIVMRGPVIKGLEYEKTVLFSPQWIQCDLRYFDTSVLGKFAVVMADPPWDIHMELPYGTLSDDEMRRLGVPNLQDNGLLFLWVTGRAMELGRECLSLWGYEYVDEIVWVKTNQLQRIIRTGRTGHWLNHGKEHCLIGMKGNPKNLNRGIDCDVIVAEVRETSHKPDELYGIIERLSPGTRKIELFGRAHNVQPNWLTLGNQVKGIRLVDPKLIAAFRERYPDGNCMLVPKK